MAPFSKSLDMLSRRENLWGFGGHSGQMFLNSLMRSADRTELEEALRSVIGVPADEADAEARLESFLSFVAATQDRAARLRIAAPKPGYVPYFLSFFWEAKGLEWPIYYPRSRRALVLHGLFRETGSLPRRYIAFRREILRLTSLFQTSTCGVEVFLFEITAEEEEGRTMGLVELTKADEFVEAELVEVVEKATDVEREATAGAVKVLLDEVAAANDRLGATRAETTSVRRDLNAYLEALSFGMDVDAAPLPRFAELNIYTQEASSAPGLEDAAIFLAEAFGFIVIDEFPRVQGSSFRRFTTRLRRLANRAQFDERFAEVDRAFQIQEVDLPQAEVDALQAQAVSQVLDAIRGVDKASIKFGSLVVLKDIDGITVRTFTPVEMLRFSRDPSQVDQFDG